VNKDAYIYIGESRAAFKQAYDHAVSVIYAVFEPNRCPQFGRNWALTGFHTESSTALENIAPLPKPLQFFPDAAYGFHPNWSLRLNLEHMLYSEENLNRLPESIRTMP
jgi:hypothetical protein